MGDVGLFVIAGFVIVGIATLVLIPLRLWQLFRGRLSVVRATLGADGRFVTALGFIGLVLLGIGWFSIPAGLLICQPWKPLCESVAFTPFLFLAPGYLLVELLLLPITRRQLQKGFGKASES